MSKELDSKIQSGPLTRITGASRELYLFVIDTNAYAGNFEREIGGYCTGCVGDCKVGGKEAGLFVEKYGEELQEVFENIISRKPDEHGCCRPVDILGYGEDNNSIVIYFQERPTKEQIALMKERAIEFARFRDTNGLLRNGQNQNLEVKSFRLLKETTKVVIKGQPF